MHLRYRRIALALAVALALAGPAPSARAQVRDPELDTYLFVSDALQSQAVWVNPGGLGFTEPFDALGQVTWTRPGDGGWRASQYLVGAHAKILGGGYRHDEFTTGPFAQGDAYTVALGWAAQGTGLGVSRTWHRVGPGEGSWTVGLAFRRRPQVSVGLVWRDIGSPSVRGTERPSRVVGAITVRPPRTPLALSAQVDYRTSGGGLREVRIGGTARILNVVDGLALAAWDGDGDFVGLWLGVRLPLRFRTAAGAATAVAGLDTDLNARTGSAAVQLVDQR